MEQQLSLKLWFLEASGTGYFALTIMLVLSLAVIGLAFIRMR
jgi:hypothetical protein